MVPRVGAAANVTVDYPSLQCSSSSDLQSIIQTASGLLNSTQGSSGCLALSTCAANISGRKLFYKFVNMRPIIWFISFTLRCIRPCNFLSSVKQKSTGKSLEYYYYVINSKSIEQDFLKSTYIKD